MTFMVTIAKKTTDYMVFQKQLFFTKIVCKIFLYHPKMKLIPSRLSVNML